MKRRVRCVLGSLQHRAAAAYALRVLLECVLDPESISFDGEAGGTEEVVLGYGPVATDIRPEVTIPDSGFFGARYLTPGVLPLHPVRRLEGIPALYAPGADGTGRFFSVAAGVNDVEVTCAVDVVAGAFFLLSCYEEVVAPSLDQLGRFPAQAGIAWREGFLQEAVVNAYAEKLLDMLRCAGFAGDRRQWWKKAPWAIALTHDVDQLHRFPRGRPPGLALARRLAQQGGQGPSPVALLGDYGRTLLHRKRDEYDCLVEMATWEASRDIRASYYFLSDRHGRLGADYDVQTPLLRSTANQLQDLGHEIGFHAGITAYNDVHEFHSQLQQLQALQIPVRGGRQHYLRWCMPQTWRLWEAEGLAYDATLGFSAEAGFRCGICLPFRPYDLERDRVMELWEWPLMFMDESYRTCWQKGERALDRLTGVCRQYGGVLVLLWHNRNWSPLYAPEIHSTLQRYLCRAQVQGAVVTSVLGLGSGGAA